MSGGHLGLSSWFFCEALHVYEFDDRAIRRLDFKFHSSMEPEINTGNSIPALVNVLLQFRHSSIHQLAAVKQQHKWPTAVFPSNFISERKRSWTEKSPHLPNHLDLTTCP